jgi:magnesium chelatase family protein
VLSSAVIGIDGCLVEVEVDIIQGLPAFTIVGLPETSVKESKERVKSAINNSGYPFPADRITVNLAPANIKKEGTAFDLPIALGILAATGIVSPEQLSSHWFMGELSLDGRVKSVNGTLPMALAARAAGYRGIIVPDGNGREVSFVSGIEIVPVKNLSQLVEFLQGRLELPATRTAGRKLFDSDGRYPVDFSEVRG